MRGWRPTASVLDRCDSHHIAVAPYMELWRPWGDPMNTIFLLEKLRDIEKALDLEDMRTTRRILADVRQRALDLQHNSPEQMRRDSRHNSQPKTFRTTYCVSVDYRYL
jgi:hypothetical protein